MPTPDRRAGIATAAGAVGVSAELLAQVARMTELARAGEWHRIAELVGAIGGMADRLPTGDRRESLVAARTGIDQVTALATAARNELGERLTLLRNGRKAAASYRATGTLQSGE